jgi:hypothetical protein
MPQPCLPMPSSCSCPYSECWSHRPEAPTTDAVEVRQGCINGLNSYAHISSQQWRRAAPASRYKDNGAGPPVNMNKEWRGRAGSCYMHSIPPCCAGFFFTSLH